MALAAALAPPDVHLHAATDRPRLGELLLILVGDPFKLDLPATLTTIPKRRLDRLIDLLRHRPMRVLAIPATWLTPRATRLRSPVVGLIEMSSRSHAIG